MAALHLSALLDAYYLHLTAERQASASTAAAHRRTLEAFLRHAGTPLDQIGVADLDVYTRRPHLAEGTRAQYISHLRCFTRWAAAEGYLDHDPFVRVRLPKVGPPPPSVREVSLDDVGRLLAYATPWPRLWVSAWLCYGAGLRCAEVAAGRREWVQLSAAQPHMDIYGKGRRWRTVPLAPLLTDVLKLWLAQDWPSAAGPLVGSARDPQVHVGAGWISRQLCGALHTCGIAQTAHGLRHAFARLLLAECNDLRAVSELLGHASVATTERHYVSGVKAATSRAVGFLPDPRI